MKRYDDRVASEGSVLRKSPTAVPVYSDARVADCAVGLSVCKSGLELLRSSVL